MPRSSAVPLSDLDLVVEPGELALCLQGEITALRPQHGLELLLRVQVSWLRRRQVGAVAGAGARVVEGDRGNAEAVSGIRRAAAAGDVVETRIRYHSPAPLCLPHPPETGGLVNVSGRHTGQTVV